MLDRCTVRRPDQNMLEKALLAFTTFFATIGPLDAAALFPALTPHNTAPERRRMARRGCLLGGGILTFFALVGHEVLAAFGIGLPALRTAGGVLLLLIAIDMVFARPSGGTTTTEDEQAEAATKQDISVFPLATPLIAGPGAIGAAILLAADVRSNPILLAVVIASMLSVVLLTYVLLLAAAPVQRLLGVTGLNVVSRIAGVLLAALAVQFLFDGIRDSGMWR